MGNHSITNIALCNLCSSSVGSRKNISCGYTYARQKAFAQGAMAMDEIQVLTAVEGKIEVYSKKRINFAQKTCIAKIKALPLHRISREILGLLAQLVRATDS